MSTVVPCVIGTFMSTSPSGLHNVKLDEFTHDASGNEIVMLSMNGFGKMRITSGCWVSAVEPSVAQLVGMGEAMISIALADNAPFVVNARPFS